MHAPAESRQELKVGLAIEVLRTSGRLELCPRGYSMLPTLWPGDTVTVQAYPFEQVEPGQVILYQRQGRLYLHRVIGREPDGAGLVTRGDAMSQCDAAVRREEFLGMAVAVRTPGEQARELGECSALRRAAGWLMGSSDRVRSLALRWRGRSVRHHASSLEALQG